MVNVIPKNDERRHRHSSGCWCGPAVEWADPKTGKIHARGPLIIHSSADCREVSEAVTGECVAPDLKWEIIAN